MSGGAYAALILLLFCGGWPWLLTKRMALGAGASAAARLPPPPFPPPPLAVVAIGAKGRWERRGGEGGGLRSGQCSSGQVQAG